MTHRDVLLTYGFAQDQARAAYEERLAQEEAELELGNAYIPPAVMSAGVKGEAESPVSPTSAGAASPAWRKRARAWLRLRLSAGSAS